MKTSLTHTLGLAMAAVLILLAILLSSCADDADLVIPETGKSLLPFPATPELLMGNFHEAYAARDLAAYAEMLHRDFTFRRADGGLYDRDTELRIAARMFSGEDHVKAHATIAGITGIAFDRFEGLGEWMPVADEERDVLGRSYLVSLRFQRTDGSVLRVRGSVLFQVIREELDDGADGRRDGWRILGQVDGT